LNSTAYPNFTIALYTEYKQTTLKIHDIEYYDLKGVMTKPTCRHEAQPSDVYLLRQQFPFCIISVDFFFDKKLEQIFVNVLIYDH
jgi:abortive infection bacteriophage resistance protein